MNILCFYAYNRLWPVEHLRQWCVSRGHDWAELKLWTNWYAAWDAISAVRRADHVFIWNGQDAGCEWIRRACVEEGKPFTVVEWGWLPQQEHYHFDPSGIIGDSSLCGSLDWVTPRQMAEFRVFREWYRQERGLRWCGDVNGPVLVPLQIEHDSSILFHSPIKRMSDLVRRVCEMHPGREIRVVRHPRNPRQQIKLADGHRWTFVDGPTLQAAQHAGLVVGINSTSLIETALLGVPTVALGRCPLAAHADDVDRLLAAYVARQIPRSATDLTPWLEAIGVHL